MHQQLDTALQPHLGTPVVVGRDERALPSFWYVQFAGWTTFFLFVLVATLPGLKRLATLVEDISTVAFMFLASCVLHPICKKLQRSSLSWLRVEARTLLWCLAISPVASLFAVLPARGFREIPWAEWLVVAIQFTIVLFLWCNLYLNAKYRQQAASGRAQ